MQQGIDFKLARKKELGYLYDLSITNGELDLVNNFDTCLQMIIYCERRADSSEVIKPERRRGWWGNTLAAKIGAQIGSKLWLLKQSRLDQNTVNKAIAYAQEACQEELVDDGYLHKVEVSAIASSITDGSIQLMIKLYRSADEVEVRYFDWWNNTESFDERSL